MGEQRVKTEQVIDDTFKGLSHPSAVHRMGRPDIEEGRPGDDLVAEVKRFEAEGGFKKMADDRKAAREREERLDRENTTKEELADFGLKTNPSEAQSKTADLDKSDDK